MLDVDYWNLRYHDGRGSGPSSQGPEVAVKAGRVNRIVRDRGYQTVVDWGVGDGLVAAGFDVPRYIGLDVSKVAVRLARQHARPGWELHTVSATGPSPWRGDLALSFDVLFHLTRDQPYWWHLERLFGSAGHVLIRASNYDAPRSGHMRRRRWTDDVPAGWRLIDRPPDDVTEGFWEYVAT
jgi:hypothetical protein